MLDISRVILVQKWEAQNLNNFHCFQHELTEDF